MNPRLTAQPSFLLSAAFLASLAPLNAADIQFNRDIRPILSEKCFGCHGADPHDRKGNRRLDTPEGAAAEIDGIRAIVPGDLEKSDSWQRILSKDREEVMPPPKSHKVLSENEKALIKQWIAQGAPYQKHWAFEAPQRVAPPAVKKEAWARNAVDRFVLAQLEAKGLEPAPEADRWTLGRRLALDLTGLPPSREDIEAFVKDTAPDAYEKLVAKWINTPQWGEHRGRYWLDAARYADTHGLHFDNYREMWPYRDWVISAFNRNQPFDQFTVEQIAGDLLPNPSREQLIATGFHRCNATTNEAGTIDEENLAFYANDRVTTTSWVWLGLTANCAACHDHKFDPITTKDFYSMAAFFRNTTQLPRDGNVKDSKPVLYLPIAADEKRFVDLGSEIRGNREAQTQRRTSVAPEFNAWLETAKPEDVEVSTGNLLVDLALEEGEGVEVKGATGKEMRSFAATGPLEWREAGKFGKAPALLNGTHLELGDLARFDRDHAFSAACWVQAPAGVKDGALMARMDDTQGRQGWEVSVQGAKVSVQIASTQPKGALRVATKGNVLAAGKWNHILATYDGSGKSSGLKIYVDGRPEDLVIQADDLKGTAIAEVPLRIGQRQKGGHFEGGMVQDVRIYARELSKGEARSFPVERTLQTALGEPVEKRTAAQKNAILSFYLDNRDRPYIELFTKLESLEEELAAIQQRATVTHIQEERQGSEPMAHILQRGAYDKLGEKVTASGFSAMNPMPEAAPKNRLGLAQWLVAPENPLTARVTVNRFWQEIFGTGLVRTTEDLGTQGDLPSHPELLDWLSLEFRESGWDVKKLFTLLVTSATYRQSAVSTPQKLEKDPQNRLLSRGPRFRVDAEVIRDYALASSGLLVRKVGGPSVKPYQPEGVWEAVAMTGSNTRSYKIGSSDALYRRSLYTFWKRAAPPASMDIFNAPSRETCTVRRDRTNTPLQALATLNDPQFIEAARQLAQSSLEATQGDVPKAIGAMAARVLLRPLKDEENNVLLSTAEALEKQFSQDAQSAAAFLAVGGAKVNANLPAPQLAALTLIANQLFNLDEALNK